jgi:hypothetical protein
MNKFFQQASRLLKMPSRIGKLPRNLLLTLILLAPAQVWAQSGVESLNWLSGCWSSESSGRTISEQWMRPAGGTLFGMNRTISNGKTVAYEFLQVRNREAGGIELIARPSGQEQATFTLKPSGPREAVFENPDHDFPQRVIYRAIGNDSLLGRIEGSVGGKERSADFPMIRVSCP